MRLSPEDHRRVAAEIRRAEERTSGEIFVVVAAQSGDYRELQVLWGGLFALLGGFVAAAVNPDMSAASLVLGQGFVFLLVALAALVPPWRPYFVPRAVRHARAAARAREQFLAQNLHATNSRTGVLIYVSLAERHVEIVADTAVDSTVAGNFWQGIVDRLTAEIAAGRLTQGLVLAVEACGETLARNFPRRPDDRNELPDKLVEI